MTKEEAIESFSEEIREWGMVPKVLNDYWEDEDGDIYAYVELAWCCPIHGQPRGYANIDRNVDGTWGGTLYECIVIVGPNQEITYESLGVQPCCEAFGAEKMNHSKKC